MTNVSVLEVLLYGESIGTLTHVGGDRTLFAFNDDYIDKKERAVLGLRFKDEFGNLRTDFNPTQTRLMPFFSNLLPEGHMRSYLAEQHNVKAVREFFLLWALGLDLPGALTVRPIDAEDLPPLMGNETDGNDEQNVLKQNRLRFSLAGVQLKFSAVQEKTGGLTIPAKGIGGSWIIKLPSFHHAKVPENEFSMMTLAGLVGIDVPAVGLVDIDSITNLPTGIEKAGSHAFIIERFDRLKDGTPIHIEDFAQVFDVYPEEKYDNASYRKIASVIAAESNHEDIAEFIRRLIFNTLIGNADMHLKNWSLMYPDRHQTALAPAYDFVSTISYIPDEEAALKFSRTKRFREFDKDELRHLAAKARLPEKLVLDTAAETTERFMQHWQQEQRNLPITQEVSDAIEAHLKTLPIIN